MISSKVKHLSQLAPPAGAPQPVPGVAMPQTEADVEQTLRVARNSAELLTEMLAPIRAEGVGASPGAVKEVFITDLVDQCYRYVCMCVISTGAGRGIGGREVSGRCTDEVDSLDCFCWWAPFLPGHRAVGGWGDRCVVGGGVGWAGGQKSGWSACMTLARQQFESITACNSRLP